MSAEEHLVIFKKSSRGKKLTVRISWRGFMENPLSVRSTRVARRLWPHQEVNLRRIVSHRIIVGLPISCLIRQKLHWGYVLVSRGKNPKRQSEFRAIGSREIGVPEVVRIRTQKS